MLRKLAKNIAVFALLVLAIGVIFFMPSIKKSTLSQAESLNEESTINPDAFRFELGSIEDVSSADIRQGSFYGQTVYYIYTALGLSSVAYHVNNGDSGYSTATYVLANDIDLQGYIWTPIGTVDHPFQGVFLGEGHSISNVVVQSGAVASGSGHGLFGNITNANISDLILEGQYSISSIDGGTLVGVATNSTIISVHDNAIDDVGGNVDMSQIYTIGRNSSGVQAFASRAIAQTTISSNGTPSITNGGVSDLGIQSHIDSQASITYPGYAVYYYGTISSSQSLEFFVNSTKVADGGGYRVRVLTSNTYGDYTGTLYKDNPFYHKNKVRLREDLSSSDTDVPYPIREEYKSTIGEPSSQNHVIQISQFEHMTTTIYLRDNYGQAYRHSSVAFYGYDVSLESFLNSRTYLLDRLGYTLNSITTQSKGNISQSPSFYYNYPSYASDTLTFNFTPLTDRSFDFMFLIDSENFSSGSMNYSQLSSAINNVSVNRGVLDTTYVSSNGRYTVRNLTSDNPQTNNQVTITFTLEAGFEIAVVTEGLTQGTLVINSDDANNGFDGNSNYAYSQTSGVYLNFANFTGSGSSYNSNGANNDSENEVTATGTVQNSSGSGVVSGKEERTYTVTISNIVGTTGNVFFVVKRAIQDINIITNVYAYEDGDTDCFAWTYDGTTYRENAFVVTGGIGETVEIILRVDNDVNYFIISQNTSSSALSFDRVVMSGGRNITVNNITYYSYVSFRLTIDRIEDDMSFTVGIGAIRSYFKFEVEDSEGNIISLNENDNSTKGISGVVNDIEGVGLNGTGYLEVRGSEGVLADYVAIATNGYYLPTHITINRVGTGNVVTNAVLEYNSATEMYEWTTSSPAQNVFNQIYQGGQDFDFIITIAVSQASYSLGWDNFTFHISNGTTTTSYTGRENQAFLEDLFSLNFNSTSFTPGESGTVTLTLTEIGLAILYGNTANFNANTINGFNETVEEGFSALTINSTNVTNVDSGIWQFTFTSGTYAFDFNYYFTYKEINIDVNGLVLNGSYSPISTTAEIFVGNSGTYRYNYSFSNGSGQVTLANATFGGIQIHSQYYVLGWYLRNGEVVTISNINYNDIVSNANMLSAYQDFSRTGNALSYTINVQAIVAQRTVTLNYSGGNEGKGELISIDTSSDSLTYSTSVILKQAYRNKGYTFNGYSYTINDTVFTVNSGSNFTITGLNFARLFGSQTLLKTWTSFVEEGNLSTSSTTTLTLTSNWSVIRYNLIVDGTTSLSALEIGDEIRFSPSDPGYKNGQGTYYIYRNNVQVSSIKGSALSGYTASGFELSGVGRLTAYISGSYATISFDGDNFNTLVGSNYDTLQNITATTLRSSADYRIYIANSKYYTVTISESGSNYGQDSNGVYVVATYGKPTDALNKNSQNFLFNTITITGKAITISREGYQFSGDFYNFDPSENFDSLTNLTISPIFTKAEGVVVSSATIRFNDDSTGANFYLLNSHNITQGGLIDLQDLADGNDDSEITLGSETIYLSNGDRVTGYGFVVTLDQQTYYYPGREFNINNLYSDGNYQINFYIDFVDSLYNSSKDTSYRILSSSLSFTMNKNAFGFNSNFVSAYNETNEFVPTSSSQGYSNVNDYGSAYLVYAFDGAQGQQSLFDVEELFISFALTGGDYTVGEGKDLLLTIDNDYFSQHTSINGVSVNSSTNFANLISGVTLSGSDYVYTYMDGATITRARFTINFGETSAFYVDGVSLIVYNHDRNNRTFQIGRQYFSYNLTQILYIGGAVSQDTTFTGADSAVFSVVGLTVDNQTYLNNQDRSFEYVLEGQFTLLSSQTALKQSYSPRYLTATNGVLNSSLAVDYNSSFEQLYMTSVYVDGILVPVSGSQFTYEVDDNVIFSVVNNGTNDLQIIISKNALTTHTLSYRIAVDITNTRLSHLTLLTFGTSLSPYDYDSLLDQDFADPANNSDPYQEFTITSSTQDSTFYAILTDVRKVEINYNGGANASGQGSEDIYLSYSSSNGEYILNNPSHNYSGLEFNGYSNSSSDISISASGTNAYSLTSIDGGGKVELVALWSLTGVDYSLVSNELNFMASFSAIEIASSSIVSPKALVGGSYSFSLTKKDDQSISFNANDSFTFADNTGRVPTTLSGEYTFLITLTYFNSYQAQQSITQSIDISINVNRNTVGIVNTTPDLTFNNADRKNNITLRVRLNQTLQPQETLANLLQTGGDNYGLSLSISPSSEIINAGTYTISISIDSIYQNFYMVESEYSQIQVTIDKFDLTLANFVSQIEVYKYFGESDPNPIQAIIAVPLASEDQVEIIFTRQSGEAIGQYQIISATLSETIDINNYNLITDGFVCYFEIRLPESGLFVKLDGNLSYIYNGQALNSLQVRYNSNTTKFEVYGSAGEEVRQSFTLYYLSEGRTVEIPISERNDYADYLQFNSSNAREDVGSYAFTVSLTEVGQNVGWGNISFDTSSISLAYNNIVVTKRTITLNSISKVFDQSSSFSYNTSAENQNVTANLSNVVSGDTITISGNAISELAGRREVISISTDSTSHANYNLALAEGLQLLITPSRERVSLSSQETSLDYGLLKNGDSLAKVIATLSLQFNNGNIDDEYFTITNYQFTNALFSSGDYLEVGSRTVRFTITSTNYTFASEVGNVGQVYSTNIDVNIPINKLDITIINSSIAIIKDYDGNNLVDDSCLNFNVNGSSSPYLSNGLLDGDIITITGGQYNNSSIGNNKNIILLEFGQNDDSDNYNITYPTLTGSITDIALVFNKDYQTTSFVDDGESFENTAVIRLSYNGNVDTDIIAPLLDESNFVVRRGYTQTGWLYNGVQVSTTMSNKTQFLEDAVANASTGGITLQVIWQIDRYDIVIERNDSILSISDTVITVDYYQSLSESLITVTANEGYTFEGIMLSSPNGEVVQNVSSTNQGSFNVKKITGEMTVSVQCEEITIKITLDYNNPEGLAVSTEDPLWQDSNSLTLSYLQMIANDLPYIDVVKQDSYNLDYWTLNDEISQGDNIWERLPIVPTQDDLTGYTFVANWTEEEVTLTISGKNFQVLVYNQSVADSNLISGNNGQYDVTYNQNLIFVINADEFYKWTGLELNENYTALTGSPTQTSTGQFSLQIKGNLEITLTMDEIVISLLARFTAPLGSRVNQSQGSLDKSYTFSNDLNGDVTLQNFLGVYTATAGTYYQTGWLSEEQELSLDLTVKEAIIDLIGGVPTQDSSITLQAIWQGETYNLTFIKNNDDAVWTNVEESEQSSLQISKLYVYGSPMTNLPTLQLAGSRYVWTNDNGETISEGQPFTTEYPTTSLEMTFTAYWREEVYSIEVIYAGITNADKILSVTLNDLNYPSGGSGETALYGQNKDFIFTFAVGYELDIASIIANNDNSNVTLSLYGNNYTLRLGSITGDVSITVAVKPKDYTITIIESIYEDISQTTLQVSYDEDISSKFNALVFDREGYTISALYDGEVQFASFEGNSWIFSSSYTTENLYKTDSDLTLKPVYTSLRNYITLSIEPVANLTYNGQAQILGIGEVSSSNIVDTFAIGSILENGDRVVDFYYALDGERIDCQADFAFRYTNAVQEGSLMFFFVVEDSLSLSGERSTYTSDPAVVSMAKSDILTSGATLVSYYSGSSTFYPSEEDLVNNYGSLTYSGGSQISELTLARVELVDLSGQYNVGEHQVRYYLRANGEFNYQNFNNLVADNSSNLYIYSVSDVTAQVIETTITLTFNETGYYNGQAQTVTGDIQINRPDFVNNFAITIISVTTISAEERLYSQESDFVINVSISLAGADKTSNFKFAISGGYTIISASESYQVNLAGKYFNGDSVSDSNISITANAFTYAGQTMALDGDYNFSSGGELVFSITSNGTSPVILIKNGYSVTFNFVASSSLDLLAWTEDISVNALQNTLNNLTNRVQNITVQTFNNARNIYVVATDYKAVLINLGEQGNLGYRYVQLGGSIVVQSPTWTGFDFLFWRAGSGLSVSGNTVSLFSNGNILASSITAVYDLALPQAEVIAENGTIIRQAKAQKDAQTDDITVSDIIGTIINYNETAINYSYQIRYGDMVLQNGSSFTVPANTTSNGVYSLVITASKTGYLSKSITCEFNIEIERLTIESVTISQRVFVYGNVDYAETLSINISGVGVGQVTVSQILNNQANSTYYLTLSGQSTTQLREAGSYTLTLGLDNTVFVESSYSFDITITQYTYILRQADIPSNQSSKLFGLADPNFTFMLTMFTGSAEESVEVTLARQPGEQVGTYNFTQVTSENQNYNFSVENAVFTIYTSTNTLQVELNGVLLKTYSKSQPNFTLTFDNESGNWLISAGQNIVTLSLYVLVDEQRQSLSEELYPIALNGISLSYPSAITVDVYDLENVTISTNIANFANYNFIGTLQIERLGLVIASVIKDFDRTNDIISSQVTFENLMSGDDVELIGQYNSVEAGDNISLSGLTLIGDDSQNYQIANPQATGSINPLAITSSTFSLINTDLTYGQVASSTLASEIVSLTGARLNLDGTTDDLANGYIEVSSFTVASTYLSSSNYLRSVQVPITITLTSSNFTFNRQSSITFNNIVLNIMPKALDLSSLGNSIVKNYDGTTSLPSQFTPDISGYGVIAGDQVSIDNSASYYASEVVGRHLVTLILTGSDSGNYSVTNNVYGTINNYTVTFLVNATTEHIDLVTDGAFVEDGESPIVRENYFLFDYPNNYTGEELILQMELPQRQGYTATGWKILQDGAYVELNAQNIQSLIQSIALDENNTEASIEVYVVWQIDSYQISISGDNIESYTIEGNNYDQETHMARYYSDITATFTVNKGYKISRYDIIGNCLQSNLDDVGGVSGSAYLFGVASDIEIVVTASEIEISFDIDVNIPLYTARTDTNRTYVTYPYSSLASMFAQDLPALTVTEGTYTLAGYSYSEGEVGELSLKELVDSLFTSLVEDVEIDLTANWQGLDYIVSFNSAGGTITGVSSMSVTYGSAFEQALPTATLPGRSGVWTDDYGETYTNGSVFHTIGRQIDNQWTAVLVAVYQNNTYQLTVEFGSRVQVYYNGESIESGDVFDVTYNTSRPSFSISVQQGYDYQLNTDQLNGSVVENTNSVEVFNLTANGTLVIESVRGNNRMTVAGYNVASIIVAIDRQEQTPALVYNVLTESIVELRFTASEGYQFDESCLNYTATDSTIDIEISTDLTTMTVTWSNFTSDITFTVEAKPTLNSVTFGDLSSILTSLELNGESVDITGGSYGVYTDEELRLTATLRYGYGEGNVSSNIVEISISQSCEYTSGDGLYHLEATFEGIKQDFTIEITASERSYNFAIAVESGMEEMGQITCDTNQVVSFGESVILGVTALREDYVFAGWESNGQTFATEENSSIELTTAHRQMLESVSPGQTIYIYATFVERITSVSFTAGNRGQITISQEGIEPIVVTGGRTVIGQVRFGYDLFVDILPNEGYRLDKILVDGQEASTGYDEVNSRFTIFLDVMDAISTIEVTFIAKDITVDVQTIVQVNYEFVYGIPDGGYVYLVDSEGNRLEDEYYIGSSDTIYYDYSASSVTDGTLYFTIEANSGYNAVLNSPSAGVVVSEYVINGQTIYAVSGLVQDAQIQAIFMAVANNIEVRLVTQDDLTAINAGRISVNTSALNVKASQNNSYNTFITAITGSTVFMNVYSQFTFDLLADESGRLLYYIEYHSGNFDEGAVTVGIVEESDIYANGFTKSSTLQITNVNANATIYIYVQPRVYNLLFYVTEDVNVGLEQTISYGQSLPIENLSEEELSVVFSTRQGYTFGGYYTMQLAQGTQYIDGSGNLLKSWTETGYRWTGYGYVPTDNYDDETQTFTIYAAWIYDRASVELELTPNIFYNYFVNYSILDFITNISSYQYWTNQNSNWYVEVPAEASLHFEALPYQGYEFISFLVSVDGGEAVEFGSIFDLDVTTGNYLVTALYQPLLNLSCTPGGNAHGYQGSELDGQSFSTNIPLSLRAYPDEGYNFIYFINEDTGEFYYADYDIENGCYVYTFADLIYSPLNIRAVFEGKNVTIDIDFSSASEVHNIVGVYLDGTSVSFASQIYAKVGQTLVIAIEKEYGYSITVNGGNYTQSTSATGQHLFTYLLTVDGLEEVEDAYRLDIVVGYLRESINLTFNMEVEQAISANEIVRAGSLSYVDAQGRTDTVILGSPYIITYGDSVSLKIYVLEKYEISDVFLSYAENSVSIIDFFEDDQLIIDEAFLDQYQAYNLSINVIYKRLLWTDEEAINSALRGNGTRNNPYYIRSSGELAFVAYAVNLGLSNSDGLLYSEAYYQVVADINLSGRFWEPIGVPDSVFNGTMDLGSYAINDLSVYKDYTDPNLSYGGLFWCLGDDATIIRDNNTLIIVICIAGGLLLLILLIILIIYLYRRHKKKRMEEIANN